jgi:hypothetical protein
MTCLVLVLMAGCRPQPLAVVPVEGVVLMNGAPVPNIRVLFSPQIKNGGEYLATGITDAEGHFTLTCHGQSGACAGENVVSFAEDIPENLTRSDDASRAELHQYLEKLKNRPIPAQYLSAAVSPLRVGVSADKKDYKIELSR